MKYMGSKRRLATVLLPIILKGRQSPNQAYVEPFVGGANMIESVTGVRIAGDSNPYIVTMFQAAQKGWLPPKVVTESLYKAVQNNKENYAPELVGYIGFGLSFGGKFFGGYRRDKRGQAGDIGNMVTQSRRTYNDFVRQVAKLKGVKFYVTPYNLLPLYPRCVIYCDPPYAHTTKYSAEFDHKLFWAWVRQKAEEGHKVYISEYAAPKDFIPVWERKLTKGLRGGTDHTEKLFIHKSQLAVKYY